VYLSKVESLAAIREGEPQLKEGDYVRFAVVLSVEGFPQAAGAQRLHMICGTVRTFCKEQGGIINCSEGEVFVRASDCGCLLLHPGDEVRFHLERPVGSAPEAKLLKLVHTARPISSLLGCFSLELPREGQKSVVLDGHAFASCICFSGLPTDMDEAEMKKFFVKLGATQVTVAHAPQGGFSSILFPDASYVTQFLSVENHSFSGESPDGSNTLLMHLQPCRAHGAQTLPALPPPSLVQGDVGGVLVRW
jgi:cold shock CspA family protein